MNEEHDKKIDSAARVSELSRYEQDVVLRALKMMEEGVTSIERLENFLQSERKLARPAHLKFRPKPGQILLCDFSVGFRPPEVNKKRPVVVLSPRNYTRGQCIVVALSSQTPKVPKNYHLRLPHGSVPSSKYESSWAKCDLIYHVSVRRLDRLRTDQGGYVAPCLPSQVLDELRVAASNAIGLAL